MLPSKMWQIDYAGLYSWQTSKQYDQQCFIFHDLDYVVCVSQIIYIGCAYATVYLIYLKFKATYDGNHDTFRVEFLVVPVGGLAFLVNHDFSPLEVRKYCANTLWQPLSHIWVWVSLNVMLTAVTGQQPVVTVSRVSSHLTSHFQLYWSFTFTSLFWV